MNKENPLLDSNSNYILFYYEDVCVLNVSGFDQPYILYDTRWLIDENKAKSVIDSVSSESNTKNQNIYLKNNKGEVTYFEHLFLTGNPEVIKIRNFAPLATTKKAFYM